jgi:uncharacterized protein (DUF1499 family)
LKTMLMFLTAAAVVIFVAVATFVLIGPERVWSLFGPADLGSVDFARLERRSSPNDALACPAGLCRVKIDVVPPVFAIDARRLRATMAKALTSESRLALAHADDATLTDRYVQRSALLGFPDTIVVSYVDHPGDTSTVAIYSRSQLGYGDLGVNRGRIERWLEELKQVAPVVK